MGTWYFTKDIVTVFCWTNKKKLQNNFLVSSVAQEKLENIIFNKSWSDALLITSDTQNGKLQKKLQSKIFRCESVSHIIVQGGDTLIWYGKTRIASCELQVESLKAQVEIQKSEFKSTSYEFKSTSSRIIKSTKTRVNTLLKQLKLIL